MLADAFKLVHELYNFRKTCVHQSQKFSVVLVSNASHFDQKMVLDVMI